MSEQNLQVDALNNLREFKEMSYADVYSLICQQRFEDAKAKYSIVLESVNQGHFDAALSLQITSDFDDLLDFISTMASSVSNPEKIRAVGFDLSAHAIYETQDGITDQGIEVNLYSEDTYDFLLASDDELRIQCESAAAEWQGAFMKIDVFALGGFGQIARQFDDYANSADRNPLGIIEKQDGKFIVDPIEIARHVAKLLVAIEYHRYMAAFVAQVEVPTEMVFIIGEHDEIEVPIVFYRVGEEAVEAPEPLVYEAPSMVYEEDTIKPAPVEAVEEPARAELVEEPAMVEEDDTPPLYHDELMVIQRNEAMHLENMNRALDETIRSRSKAWEEANQILPEAELEAAQAEAEPDVSFEAVEVEQVISTETETQTETDTEKEAKRISAKSMIGLPLKQKAFGKCSNKLIEPEPEDGLAPAKIKQNA